MTSVEAQRFRALLRVYDVLFGDTPTELAPRAMGWAFWAYAASVLRGDSDSHLEEVECPLTG